MENKAAEAWKKAAEAWRVEEYCRKNRSLWRLPSHVPEQQINVTSDVFSEVDV